MMRRLNLGCGSKYMEGWVNVDFHARCADLNADIRTLVMKPGSFHDILCVHVIEHLSKDDGISLIRRCASWLESEGNLVMETPSWDKCNKLARSKKRKAQLNGMHGAFGGRGFDKEEWRRYLLKYLRVKGVPPQDIPRLVGKWDVPGDNHVYLWNAVELVDEFEKAGLRVAVVDPKFHGARVDRDIRVEGYKSHAG